MSKPETALLGLDALPGSCVGSWQLAGFLEYTQLFWGARPFTDSSRLLMLSRICRALFLHTRPQKMNTSSSTLPAPLSILDCTTCTVQQVLCNIQRTSHHPLLLFLSCAPSSRNAMVSHFQSDGLNPRPMSASLERWLWSKDFAEGVLCLSLYRKLNLCHQRTQLLPSLSLQPCLGPHLLPFCKKKTLFWSRHLSKFAHYIVTTNKFSKHPLKHGL